MGGTPHRSVRSRGTPIPSRQPRARVLSVLFERRLRDGIDDGSITVAFRRWRRSQVRVGNRYRTGTGMIEVDAVDVVAAAGITDRDARRAGYASAAKALADLRGPADLPIFRLVFHRVDAPDPRDQAAHDDRLTAADVADLDRRLDRLDRASPRGPWTAAVLHAVATGGGVRAADLAAALDWETLPFKANVRKLKNLGLTLSLDVGYRLSPRGEAYLRATRRTPPAGTGASGAGGRDEPARRGGPTR